MDARDIIRAKILADVLGKMSDDEKRMLIQISQGRHAEVMSALNRSGEQLGELSDRIGKHPFASDLLANVVGNYITSGLTWIVKSVGKKIL